MKTPHALVALGLMAVLASTAGEARSAPSAEVLGPEAEALAQRVGRALAQELACGLREVSLTSEGVRIGLDCAEPRGMLDLRLQGPGTTPGPFGVATRHGVLTFPAGQAPLPGLGERIDRVQGTMPWRRAGEPTSTPPVYGVDPGIAETVTAQRIQARRTREAPLGSPSHSSSAPAHQRRLPSPLSPGDVSAWLAAGGSARPCPEPCLDDEIRALLDDRTNVPSGQVLSWIRRLRGEPKLWAAAAGAAWREGDVQAAVSYADVATRMDPRDGDARRVWAQLTTGTSGEEDGAILPDLIGDRRVLPPWAWLALAAALWLVLGWRNRRERFVTAVVVAGIPLGGLLYALAPGDPDPVPPPPSLPPPLVAPLAGGACVADPPLWTPQGWQIYATCDGQPTSFVLGPEGVDGSSPEPGAIQGAAVRHLQARVGTARGEGLSLSGRPQALSQAHTVGPRRDTAEVSLCAGIAGAAALALLWLQVAFGRGLWRRAREDRLLAICLAVGALFTVGIHLGLPSRLVMTYTGYDLVGRLAFLDTPPRYGAGAPWLYAPWFAALGIDHATVQAANRCLGALTWLPVVVLALTVGGGSRWAGASAALLFAALPVVWRDHTSEGIQAGTTWVLLSALAGWAWVVTQRSQRGLLLAVVPAAAFAVVCRPEVAPALLVAALGLWTLEGDNEDMGEAGSRWTDPATWLAFACVIAATVPHGLWLQEEIQRLVGEGAISRLGDGFGDRVMHTLLQDNILLSGPWVPGALSVWLMAGLILRGSGAFTCAALMLAACVWISISSVDLPVVSIPRVHLPAFLLLLPVIAVGVERLRVVRFANPVLAAWLIGASVVSGGAILASGPEDVEDALIRAAADATAPEEGACVARMGYGDPPHPGKTQRHFPDYLFPGRQLLDLSQVDGAWEQCPAGVVAILGTRCYLGATETDDDPVPPTMGDLNMASSLSFGGAHPVCGALRAAYILEPILEERLTLPPHSGSHMYPDVPFMLVGTYRLAPSPDAAPPRR